MRDNKVRRSCPYHAADPGTPLGPGEEPGCLVELTEVHRQGKAWWTLRFEATGPADPLRRELEVTVPLVFARWQGARYGSLPVVCGMARLAARCRNPPLILNSLSCG